MHTLAYPGLLDMEFDLQFVRDLDVFSVLYKRAEQERKLFFDYPLRKFLVQINFWVSWHIHKSFIGN